MKFAFLRKVEKLEKSSVRQIVLLGIAEVLMFAITNFLVILLPQAHKFLHVTEEQFYNIIAIYGGVTILSYIPAGILTDKFNNKKLILGGLLGTIPLLIWFAILVQFGEQIGNLLPQYVIIVVLWGMTTSLLFWIPAQKMVSQKATKENQGSAYSVHGVTNGIFASLLVWGIGVFAIYLSDKYASKSFFAYYIYWTCFLLLVISLLIHYFVDDSIVGDGKRIETNQDNVEPKTLLKVILTPKVWLVALGIMSITFYLSILAIYLKDVLSVSYGMSVTLVGSLAGLRFFFARIIGSSFGRIADKFRSFILTNAYLLIVSALLLIPFVVLDGPNSFLVTLPPDSNYQMAKHWILGIFFVLTGVVGWMMFTIQWSQVIEIPRPPRSYGTTISFMTLIGYSSRVIMLPIIAYFIGKYQVIVDPVTQESATPWFLYQNIIYFAIFFSLFGSLVLFLVYFSNARQVKKLNKTSHKWRDIENY